MLSIGVMSPGQAGYYVELAREDYYLEGGEPPGVWLGTGAEALGLSGQVEANQLYNLFAGKSPDGSRDLIQRQRHDDKAEHRAGWDLTFSAPKSVSALWALSDEATRQKIEEAHFEAVKTAVAFLETEAARTRRGKGGAELEPAKIVVAAYEHGTSRAQEPQLHTHALLLNVCVREDGTTGTVSTPLVFDYKMAAGAIYRARLQDSLLGSLEVQTRAVGVFFEILGVPERLTDEWSSRRKEVEAELAKRGLSGGKASASITLETRSVKETLPRDELFAKWALEAQSVGCGRDEVLSQVRGHGRSPEPPVDASKRQSAEGPIVRERSEIYHHAALEAIWERGDVGAKVESARREISQLMPVGGDRVATADVGSWAKPERSDHSQGSRRDGPRIGITGGGEERLKELKKDVGIEWHTVEGFFARLEAEHRRDSLRSLGRFVVAPNLLEPLQSFQARFGPDLNEPLRELARKYGPDLRTLGKFGPDVREAFSSVWRSISEPGSIAKAGTIVLDMPEKIPTKQLFAIFDYAGAMMAKPMVYRRPKAESPGDRSAELLAMAKQLKPEQSKGIDR